MTSIGVFQIKTLQQDSRDRFQSSYTVLLSFLNFNLFASHSKTSGFADSELSKRPTRFASLPFRMDHGAPSLCESSLLCLHQPQPALLWARPGKLRRTSLHVVPPPIARSPLRVSING
jgi:hypothetical protein